MEGEAEVRNRVESFRTQCAEARASRASETEAHLRRAVATALGRTLDLVETDRPDEAAAEMARAQSLWTRWVERRDARAAVSP